MTPCLPTSPNFFPRKELLDFSLSPNINMGSGGLTRLFLLPFEVDISWVFNFHFLHRKFSTNLDVKGVNFYA